MQNAASSEFQIKRQAEKTEFSCRIFITKTHISWLPLHASLERNKSSFSLWDETVVLLTQKIRQNNVKKCSNFNLGLEVSGRRSLPIVVRMNTLPAESYTASNSRVNLRSEKKTFLILNQWGFPTFCFFSSFNTDSQIKDFCWLPSELFNGILLVLESWYRDPCMDLNNTLRVSVIRQQTDWKKIKTSPDPHLPGKEW